MGNNAITEVKMSELSTIRGGERFLDVEEQGEILEPVYCCCFRIGRRSYEVLLSIQRKLWRRNLETNFQ